MVRPCNSVLRDGSFCRMRMGHIGTCEQLSTTKRVRVPPRRYSTHGIVVKAKPRIGALYQATVEIWTDASSQTTPCPTYGRDDLLIGYRQTETNPKDTIPTPPHSANSKGP